MDHVCIEPIYWIKCKLIGWFKILSKTNMTFPNSSSIVSKYFWDLFFVKWRLKTCVIVCVIYPYKFMIIHLYFYKTRFTHTRLGKLSHILSFTIWSFKTCLINQSHKPFLKYSWRWSLIYLHVKWHHSSILAIIIEP